MKALQFIALVGVVVFVFWHLQQEDRGATSIAARSPVPSPVPAEVEVVPVPQAVKDIESEYHVGIVEAQSLFNRTVTTQPREHFTGSVVEHLADGHLLVQEGQPLYSTDLHPGEYAIFGYPGTNDLADSSQFECWVVLVGTYRFHATDGSMATVYEAIYTDQQQVTAAPTAGSWMWQH